MELKVSELSFSYGKHSVLNGLSFTVKEGEAIALLGANGAGKSTLIRCLLGFTTHYEGCITLDGTDIKSLPRSQLSARVAYIPQSASSVFNYTVLETVLMGTTGSVSLFQKPRGSQLETARQAIAELGIEHLTDCGIAEISGGERQLVLLARALAQKAQLLIMDEPTTALDYGNRHRVLAMVRSLANKGYTILYSTHDPGYAKQYATRVLALKDGALLVDGPAEDNINRTLIHTLYNLPETESFRPREGEL